MLTLMLLLATAAPAPTLELERDPEVWPQPDVWIVEGYGYKDRWVTISVWNADGSVMGWGPWAPEQKRYGEANVIAKPFAGFVSGRTYRVDVRKGYQSTPQGGTLIKRGSFTIP